MPPAVAAATAFGAYINSASFDAQGIELSADAAIGAGFRVSASYTYLDAEVTEAFGAERRVQPGVPDDSDRDLFAARRRTSIPAAGELGHVVHRATPTGPFDVALSGYFVGSTRRQHVPERRLLRELAAAAESGSRSGVPEDRSERLVSSAPALQGLREHRESAEPGLRRRVRLPVSSGDDSRRRIGGAGGRSVRVDSRR